MRPRKYSDEQLLLDYLNASNKAGGWIKLLQINTDPNISATHMIYFRRFKSLENAQRLIIEKFPNLLNFDARVSISWQTKTNEEILNAIIYESTLAGYKLNSKDIDTNKFLPRYATVRCRLGSIERIYSLAGKISKDFLELPRYVNRNRISNEERDKRNNIVISKYIEACLEQNCIIHVTKISAPKTGFCCRYIYKYFENIENFRSECAKASPEFAELLARHNQKSI